MQRSAPLPPGSGRPSLTAPPLGGYDHADAVVVSTGNALIAWDDSGSAGIGRKNRQEEEAELALDRGIR